MPAPLIRAAQQKNVPIKTVRGVETTFSGRGFRLAQRAIQAQIVSDFKQDTLMQKTLRQFLTPFLKIGRHTFSAQTTC